MCATKIKRSKLPTLKYRCITGDMIKLYKILTNKYDSRVNMYLKKQQDSITRGYSLNTLYIRTGPYEYLVSYSYGPEQ